MKSGSRCHSSLPKRKKNTLAERSITGRFNMRAKKSRSHPGADALGDHASVSKRASLSLKPTGSLLASDGQERANLLQPSAVSGPKVTDNPLPAANDIADQPPLETQPPDVRDVVLSIRIAHRRRRYALKQQQGVDRRCEGYVRSNYTNWHPEMKDDDRERIHKEVEAHLNRARSGEHEDAGLIDLVRVTDEMRAPVDRIRSQQEKLMEKLAAQLPGYDFVKSVSGAGGIGFATIVAECSGLDRVTGEITTLDDYPHWMKVWKRLGFAPYEGFAGSTWKREKWRPRSLSSDEWIKNPFAGERYALMIMIADSLFRKQWQSAEKAGADEGKPTGPYGQCYADRRRVTAVTHGDWSKQHSHRDALRVMMKQYLKDLWSAWRKDSKTAGQYLTATDHVPSAAPGQAPIENHRSVA